MEPKKQSSSAWATASIAAAVVMIVALLGGVYLIDRLLGLPGRAVESGREIARDVRDLAAAFRQGEVETRFASYAGSLAGSNKLQVAELRQVEVFRRTESSSVLWGALRLPDVVVEARVPIDYVYTVDLEAPWRFELADHRLLVRAPPLDFNPPALDVSRLEYEVRASSFLRDEDEAIAALQAGLSELSRRRARELTGLVRDTARLETAAFVRNWLAASFEDGEVYSIEVVFEGEAQPGAGAFVEGGLEGRR